MWNVDFWMRQCIDTDGAYPNLNVRYTYRKTKKFCTILEILEIFSPGEKGSLHDEEQTFKSLHNMNSYGWKQHEMKYWLFYR